MQPIELTLRRFTGIRRGLRRDEVILDFRDKSGLIALIGDNGCGKTTVIDNLHPYRVMPFRAGGYSPRTFSYYDNTFGDAYKQFICAHAGRVYRCELFIKGTNKTKKTEAYLYSAEAEGQPWVPVLLPDGTVSDGKTDTYDTCVNHVFGTPEMFFTAVFSAQGRKPLSDYAAGDMKLLLSELLGLDHLLELSDRAAKAVTYLSARAEGMQAALQSADTVRATAERLDRDGAQADADLTTARDELTNARARTLKASMHLAEARAAAANLAELRQRHDRLNASRAQARRDRDDRLAGIDADIARERARAAAPELQADLNRLNYQMLGLAGQRKELEQTIASAPNPETVRKDIERLTAEEAAVQAQRDALETDLEAARQDCALLSARNQKQESLRREGTDLKTAQAGHQTRAALIATVPCVGMDINKTCPLLQNAHAAKAEAEQIEARLETFRKDWASLVEELTALRPRAARLDGLRQQALSLDHKLAVIRADLKRCQALQAGTAAADQARKTLDHVRDQVQEAEAAIHAKQVQISACAAECQTRITALEGQKAGVNDAHALRVSDIDKDAADLPPITDAGADISAATDEMRSAEASQNLFDGRVTRLTHQLATARAERQALNTKLVEAEQFRADAAAINDDIAQWKLLARGLGKDGIVALSIDDSGPTLSAITNDILAACYGPRFAVRFDTLLENKSGVIKETFDIRVFDSECDGDNSVSMSSGGERIWINEALTSAIGLLMAQQAGQSYGCRFSDESDGALTADRKQQFMQMKRRVLELGGYTSEFYITHTPELWEVADHVINIEALRAS